MTMTSDPSDLVADILTNDSCGCVGGGTATKVLAALVEAGWRAPADEPAELTAARRVIGLVGATPVQHGERAQALFQAWMDFVSEYGNPPRVSDEEIADLARRRAEIRAATLARLQFTTDGEADRG